MRRVEISPLRANPPPADWPAPSKPEEIMYLGLILALSVVAVVFWPLLDNELAHQRLKNRRRT